MRRRYGPTGLSSAVTVKTGLLSRQTVDLESRLDPDWLWFDNELALTPLEYEVNRNRPLLQKLGEMGDVAETPRPVDFTFYFEDDSSRQAMLRELGTQGFALNDEGCWMVSDDPRPYRFSVFLITSIKEEKIAQICGDLRDCAERHRADFDGWATPLAR